MSRDLPRSTRSVSVGVRALARAARGAAENPHAGAELPMRARVFPHKRSTMKTKRHRRSIRWEGPVAPAPEDVEKNRIRPLEALGPGDLAAGPSKEGYRAFKSDARHPETRSGGEYLARSEVAHASYGRELHGG